MKDFLTEFYNKVVNFFQAEKIEGENTKETAKNRLKLVLMQDRSNLEPETMAQLREELVEVISKYIVIDKEALGLNLDGDGESMALMLNIPVVRAKTPEEIQEAIKSAKEEAAEEIEIVEEIEEETSVVEEEIEETVVEFSEGSIDELDLHCDGECKCGGCDCKEEGEDCSCENENCDGECHCEDCETQADKENETAEEKSVEESTEEPPVKKKNKKK